jgi:hypothetical protein
MDTSAGLADENAGKIQHALPHLINLADRDVSSVRSKDNKVNKGYVWPARLFHPALRVAVCEKGGIDKNVNEYSYYGIIRAWPHV